ncbi:hypothetical protein Anapl_12204 [Anas platyrhynchos]|uniref:Uncharacterized protein n=1 Tax=Anas platyrhynchos TaxID=8839 RepID=R0K1G0_ANAPL|nr:hypothetical protein Anapl_12204 [Anas platyrhynchos]
MSRDYLQGPGFKCGRWMQTSSSHEQRCRFKEKKQQLSCQQSGITNLIFSTLLDSYSFQAFSMNRCQSSHCYAGISSTGVKEECSGFEEPYDSVISLNNCSWGKELKRFSGKGLTLFSSQGDFIRPLAGPPSLANWGFALKVPHSHSFTPESPRTQPKARYSKVSLTSSFAEPVFKLNRLGPLLAIARWPTTPDGTAEISGVHLPVYGGKKSSAARDQYSQLKQLMLKHKFQKMKQQKSKIIAVKLANFLQERIKANTKDRGAGRIQEKNMGNDVILWISFSDKSVTGRQTRAVKWGEKEGNKTLKTLKTSAIPDAFCIYRRIEIKAVGIFQEVMQLQTLNRVARAKQGRRLQKDDVVRQLAVTFVNWLQAPRRSHAILLLVVARLWPPVTEGYKYFSTSVEGF